MFKHPISNPEFLKKTVLELTDDLSLPWQKYPCLLWPRSLFKDGYGMVQKNLPDGKKTKRRVHREAWMLVKGEIPEGILICHHCDNPACYRPIHLFAGSNSDNVLDCVAKGRYVSASRLHPENLPRGIDHPNSKLRNEDIPAIRKLLRDKVAQHRIAEQFGVTQTLISHINLGKIWCHIKAEPPSMQHLELG